MHCFNCQKCRFICLVLTFFYFQRFFPLLFLLFGGFFFQNLEIFVFRTSQFFVHLLTFNSIYCRSKSLMNLIFFNLFYVQISCSPIPKFHLNPFGFLTFSPIFLFCQLFALYIFFVHLNKIVVFICDSQTQRFFINL